jgi:hypothetical protein
MYMKLCRRAEPGLIVFVLDDSGSMADCLEGTTDPKGLYAERIIGIILMELLKRSTEMKGDTPEIKSRYYLYVIVYGSHPQIWGSGEMDIQSIVEAYAKAGNSFDLGGKLGGTDSAAAFQMAYQYLKEAVVSERFRSSFPPMVFHLTDGMSSTDATPYAEKIQQLSTDDGNVLIVNAYIGTETDLPYKGPEDFPGYVNLSDVGSNEDNIKMFNMSSEMPPSIRQNLIDQGTFPNIRERAHLFFDVRTKDMLKHAIQVIGSINSQKDRIGR